VGKARRPDPASHGARTQEGRPAIRVTMAAYKLGRMRKLAELRLEAA